jgi:NAD(P)-dependent dehydrogenase (short-subunit alcohol dehydrogenase family)
VRDRQLTGKVAVVTGAAQGIGRCIAEFMANDGAAVLLADIQHERVRAEARALRDMGLRAEAAHLDVRDPGSARAMAGTAIETFGKVDVLVNNAGIDAPPGAATEISEEHWRDVIDTNLTGAWWCTRAVLPGMEERRSGRIIFVSSGSARVGQPDISPAYNASKAGLIGLTVGLSAHLEDRGVLVNAIAPGYTGTGQPMTAEERVEHERRFPLGIGGPEPVAHACLYLARDSGEWVSGAVLNVSGGWVRGV